MMKQYQKTRIKTNNNNNRIIIVGIVYWILSCLFWIIKSIINHCCQFLLSRTRTKHQIKLPNTNSRLFNKKLILQQIIILLGIIYILLLIWQQIQYFTSNNNSDFLFISSNNHGQQRDIFLESVQHHTHNQQRITESPTSSQQVQEWKKWRLSKGSWQISLDSEHQQTDNNYIILTHALTKLGYSQHQSDDNNNNIHKQPFWIISTSCEVTEQQLTTAETTQQTIHYCLPHEVYFSNAQIHSSLINDWNNKNSCFNPESFVPLTRIITKDTDLTRMFDVTTNHEKSCYFVKKSTNNNVSSKPTSSELFPLHVCGTLSDISSVLRSLQRDSTFKGLIVQNDVPNVMLWNENKFTIRMWALVVNQPNNNKVTVGGYIHDGGIIYRSLEPFHNHQSSVQDRFFAHVPTKQLQHRDFNTKRGNKDHLSCFEEFQSYLDQQHGTSDHNPKKTLSEIGLFVHGIMKPYLKQIISGIIYNYPQKWLTNSTGLFVNHVCFDFVLDKKWHIWLVGVNVIGCSLPASTTATTSMNTKCKDKLRDSLGIQTIRAIEYGTRYGMKRLLSDQQANTFGSLERLVSHHNNNNNKQSKSTCDFTYNTFVQRRNIMSNRVRRLIEMPFSLKNNHRMIVGNNNPLNDLSSLPCSKCGYVNHFEATHCDGCGQNLFIQPSKYLRQLTQLSNKSSYKDRLTSVLMKYDPDRIHMIDSLLERFHGKEEMLITRLEAQYLNVIDNNNQQQQQLHSNDDVNNKNIEEIREQLIELLGQHSPQELSDVDKLLDRFKNREDQLLNQLRQRFGVVDRE
jgi:hypothetical protein